MTKDEIISWALANGWQMIDGAPSLTKPSAPHPVILRLVLKATVASLENQEARTKRRLRAARRGLSMPGIRDAIRQQRA